MVSSNDSSGRILLLWPSVVKACFVTGMSVTGMLSVRLAGWVQYRSGQAQLVQAKKPGLDALL